MPDLEQDNYSGFAMRFEFDDFDIIPSQCEVAYECTSVKYENDALPNRSMKCSDFELFGKIGGGFGTNALEITIDRDRYDNPDPSQNFAPGNYDVTITGTAVGSNGPLTAVTTFRIRLIDPCDPPQITAVKPEDQVYTLTDTARDFTAP